VKYILIDCIRLVFLIQNVSVTLVTTIRVTYNKNTIMIQITVEKCMIKSLTIT